MKKIFISLLAASLLTGCATTSLPTQTQNYPLNDSYNQVEDTVSTSAQTQQPVKSTSVKQAATKTTTSAATSTTKTANAVQDTKNTEAKQSVKTVYNGPKFTGNVLIGLKKEFAETDAKNIVTKYGLNFDRFIGGINVAVANVNSKYSLEEITDKLTAESSVEFVESDKKSTLPPDKETSFDAKENMSVLAAGGQDKYLDQQYGLSLIHIFDAWQITQGSPSVKIAVIDTGVEISHPDLKNNIIPGYDAFSKKEGVKAGDASSLNYINSTYKHGTHVAGIIAAEANNGKGIAGVAPKCKIMPIKVFPDTSDVLKTIFGSADESMTVISAVADGIVWAVDHGADVINMSLGTQEESQTLRIAVDYAISHNVPVVVSAGNERQTGNKVNFIAALPGVIGVGATDQFNKITAFSNSGSYVSVAAPGLDVISTVPSFLNWNLYTKYSGTSMAAPHVAGVIALMKSLKRDASPALIKETLENTALDLGQVGRDDLYGKGLINAYSALVNISQAAVGVAH